ncbi:SOS response-associated peptidase [Pseudomonas sivasensis]|uniref:SOS response-associated peptidase n=1 Tax=Pseudomonas sivasensis TaxID=1880678 RepID=UPI003BA1974A
MCSHYEAPAPQRVAETFGIEPFEQGKLELYPGYTGPFVRQVEHVDVDADSPAPVEGLAGSFGLIPSWSKDIRIARHTYNCRSETASQKPSFRTAWRKAGIYEPDWRSGKSISTRITRADGELLGIAGLWEQWRNPGTGKILHSYTMLTINADDHPFMRNYHKPQDEKRMVVILPKGLYTDWLKAPAVDSMEFMRQYPADRMAVAM